MTTKTITYNQLEQAIKIAFLNDSTIFKMYDQKANINTLEDLIADISLKVKAYSEAILKGVYHKDKLIGYCVYQGDDLVSFGLSVEFRKRSYLREFFQIIKKELPKPFYCMLWSRNIRAVKWLIKNKMEINVTNPSITQLIYK